MKVVIAEPITPSENDRDAFVANLKREGFNVFYYDQKPADDLELKSRIAEAEVLVVSNMPLSEDVLRAAPRLMFISIAFTGYDHVDLAYCRSRDIAVSNSPGYASIAVAEQTLMMILGLLRNVVPMHQATLQGMDRQGFIGRELSGMRVGVFGFGSIARRVMQYLVMMGAEIQIHSPSNRAAEFGLPVADKETILKSSDIVSLHVPLTDSTRGMISERELGMMKKGALLINTSRGAVVDEAALAKALQSGHLGGAALDVYSSEPPLANDHPLLHAPNVLLMPHTAYATTGSLKRRLDIVVQNIVYWLSKMPQNLVS